MWSTFSKPLFSISGTVQCSRTKKNWQTRIKINQCRYKTLPFIKHSFGEWVSLLNTLNYLRYTKHLSPIFIKEKTDLRENKALTSNHTIRIQKPVTVLNNRNKMPVNVSPTCNKCSSIHIKKVKRKHEINFNNSFDLIQYSWPLNNTGLNCTGLLICGFFSISIQLALHNSGFASSDSQE